MTFEKMGNSNVNVEDRSFVILYNFNPKENTMIKNICNMYGIRDQVILTPKNANSVVKDIIVNKIDNTCDNGLSNKSIIFNNVSHIKISAIMDSLKKFRIQRPLVAMTTESNLNWDLNTLIHNLVEERAAMKSGRIVKH